MFASQPPSVLSLYPTLVSRKHQSVLCLIIYVTEARLRAFIPVISEMREPKVVQHPPENGVAK